MTGRISFGGMRRMGRPSCGALRDEAAIAPYEFVAHADRGVACSLAPRVLALGALTTILLTAFQP